jgi:hypothetical protein
MRPGAQSEIRAKVAQRPRRTLLGPHAGTPSRGWGGSRPAEQRAIQRVLERQAELGIANQERLDREREKPIRFYEYRERAASDKLASVRGTFERLSASTEPEVQRIVPVWAKNLENAERVLQGVGLERERCLAQLLGRDQVTAQHRVFTASYVEIVSKGD